MIDITDPGVLWLSIGAILCIAEMAVPGVFLVWLGIGAALTGTTALLIDMPLWAQLGEFAVLSIVSVYLGRQFFGRGDQSSADPLLNDRLARLVGTSVLVEEAIVNGHGRVRVGDGSWIAVGADAPVGTRLRVTGANGAALMVEPLPTAPPSSLH